MKSLGASVTVSFRPAVAPARAALAERYFYIDPRVASEQLDLIGMRLGNAETRAVSTD